MTVDIHACLAGKWDDGTRPKDLFARHIRERPEKHVAAIIAGLSSGSRRVENGCAELASLLSEERPELLYPYVDLFVGNLGSKEKVLRWEAVCTLGNLARVDDDGRVPPQIPTMAGFLRDKSIVLQGHAVRALAKIAAAHHQNAGRIFEALVGAADAFPRNKVGFVIEAMEPFVALGGFEDRVCRFVEPFAESEVKVVARKAGKVLRSLAKAKKGNR
jgi:hypothetical protein